MGAQVDSRVNVFNQFTLLILMRPCIHPMLWDAYIHSACTRPSTHALFMHPLSHHASIPYVSIPSPMCTHQAHNVCMPSLRHYVCMHAPPMHPVLFVSYIRCPYTHLSHYTCVPTYSFHHACTYQSKSLCMHPSMYVPIHPIMHVCMHACTCPNHQRCVPIHPIWSVHTPFHHITHACTHPSDHTCTHACNHSHSAHLSSCCPRH